MRPVALYANPELAKDGIAQLQGPIRAVDGQDVEAKGAAFALLPGCHVVTVKPKIGEGSQEGSWSADLGLVVYAFRMEAGRLYSIEPVARFGSAGHGTVTLMAYERDPDGRVVRAIAPAEHDRDIEACVAWQEQGRPGARDLLFPSGSDATTRAPTATLSSSFPK